MLHDIDDRLSTRYCSHTTSGSYREGGCPSIPGHIPLPNSICRVEGIRGLYWGLPASLHGMVVHRGMYFGGFDTIKDILTKEAVELALWKRWLAAQAVTTSAGLLSYPFDTVRRRMMMQSGLKEPMYKTTLDCWKTIYRTDGFSSFYRGVVSNMRVPVLLPFLF